MTARAFHYTQKQGSHPANLYTAVHGRTNRKVASHPPQITFFIYTSLSLWYLSGADHNHLKLAELSSMNKNSNLQVCDFTS